MGKYVSGRDGWMGKWAWYVGGGGGERLKYG